MSNKYKVSICFVSEIESMSDPAQVKAAYKDLRGQIAKFAEYSASDPNIIISHSVVSDDPKDMKAVARTVASVKIAELQSINQRILKGKTAITDPEYKSKFEPNDAAPQEVEFERVDPDEKPHIIQQKQPWVPPSIKQKQPWVPPSRPVEVEVAQEAKSVADPTLNPNIKGKMEVEIFSKLRKTDKSMAIVKYLLDNPDKEVSVSEIATGAKLENVDVNNWLAQTGKKIKAIKSGEKRGHYLLDTSKIKV
jgi:predicted GNAT family acetyltransferase